MLVFVGLTMNKFDAIVERIRTNSGRARGRAFRELCRLTLDDENGTGAHPFDAVDALVSAMLAHPQSVAVQTGACAALGAVMDNNVDNQTRAGDAGAVDVGAYTRSHYSST